MIVITYYLILIYLYFFDVSVAAYDTYGISVGGPFIPTAFMEKGFTVAGFTRVPRLPNGIQTDQTI